jgi:hypothetical protein
VERAVWPVLVVVAAVDAALDLHAPDPIVAAVARGDPTTRLSSVHRRGLLGRIIHEYEMAAAA